MTAVQQSWAALPIQARLGVFCKARRALSADLDAWVQAVVACRDCSPAEALSSEVLPLLDGIQFLERQAAKILAPQRPSKKLLPYWLYGVDLELRRLPWGKILILGPGNYPLFLPAIQALQALAAGNAVSLKPQQFKETPLIRLGALLQECGLPPGLLVILDSSLEAAHKAIREGVDKIVLTGSLASGEAVLAAAAPRMTPVTAELSGADLIWVGPGADLALVARAARWGLGLNHGQTCMAPRRLFCQADQLPELERLLGGDGFSRVPHDSPLWASSQPPPLLCATAVDSEEAGLALAERSPYGLGAALFGDPGWAERLAPRLRVGFVTINDLIAPTADPRLPFGGRKSSGMGVTRGAEGLLGMTVLQSRTLHRWGPRYHLDPPSPGDYSILAHYTRFAHADGVGARCWGFLRMLASVFRERARRGWGQLR